MDDLFRPEAVEAAHPSSLGSIRLVTPVSHQVWALVAAAITTFLVLWLCFGHYTRRERVTGSLVPQAGVLDVVARDAGVVSQVDAKPGMRVRRGQTLLMLSSDQSSVALGDTDAAVAASLLQQQNQIRNTLDSLPLQEADQAEDMRHRIRMLDSQAHEIDMQLVVQGREAATMSALLRKVTPLLKYGYISLVVVDGYRMNAWSAQSQIGELKRERLDTESQRSQLIAQLKQLPLTTAATQHQLRGQLAQLSASIAQNDVAHDTVVRASSSGTVASLLVSAGQAVTAGRPLLAILPKGSPLEAQLLVPSDAIGFVHKGTPVVLHYQAFPYQKFGVQQGTVTQVSRTALSQVEISSLLGEQAEATPLYLVKVQLAKQDIEAYGKRQALLPGMTLDADLLLDHRRLIGWIFEPLYSMVRSDRGRM